MTTLARTVLLLTLAGTALAAPTARAGTEAPATTNDKIGRASCRERV